MIHSNNLIYSSENVRANHKQSAPFQPNAMFIIYINLKKKKESAFKNHWIYEKTIVEPKQGEKNPQKKSKFILLHERKCVPACWNFYIFVWKVYLIWVLYECVRMSVSMYVRECVWMYCLSLSKFVIFHFSCVASELRLLSCFITSVSFIYILMHFAKQFFKMYHLWKILHIAWINSTTKKRKSFKSPINCMYFIHSDCFYVFFFWMFNLYYL